MWAAIFGIIALWLFVFIISLFAALEEPDE